MKILFLFFMIIGCVQIDTDEVYYNMFKSWIYAEHVKTFFNNYALIDRPPGAEVLLVHLKFQNKSHCVYYLVPYKTKLGKIIVVENKNSEACNELNTSSPLFEIDDIQKLKMEYAHFTLKITFDKDYKKHEFEFPFYNLSNGTIHEKFKNKKVMSLYPGLNFLHSPSKLIGQLGDRFVNGRSLRCHQVNAKCENIGDYRCNECRFGWYEVADYNCPQGGSKFCGQNHCGEKNEPACPRGYKINDGEEPGICQSDLTAVYNADHVLVCQ